MKRRNFSCGVAALSGLATLQPAWAHGYRVGAIAIDHPYALTTMPGAKTGAVYLRRLRNGGAEVDHLVGARTPKARVVELHRSVVDAGVMRMRPVDAIELPPGRELRLMHGGEFHLMLIELAAPLADGDRFPMWLRFAKAGEQEVTVVTQTPRAGSGMGAAEHRH
jgi:periplasmic copper chaperone A